MSSAESRVDTLRRIKPGLVALVIIAAIAAGDLAGLGAVQRDHPNLHRTVAFVVGGTANQFTDDNAIVPTNGSVTARWRGPDGQEHTGSLAAPRPIPIGNSRTIWVDDGGRPASPPADETGAALTAGSVALSFGLGVTVVVRRSASRQVQRAVLSSIEPEWAQREPRWSDWERGHGPV